MLQTRYIWLQWEGEWLPLTVRDTETARYQYHIDHTDSKQRLLNPDALCTARVIGAQYFQVASQTNYTSTL